MIRLNYSIALRYQVGAPGADAIFNVQAAHTARQIVVHESLDLSPGATTRVWVDPPSGNRYLRIGARPGPLLLRYVATVDLDHHAAAPASLQQLPIADLPGAVLPYLYPSRYCESDRLQPLAMQHFGQLPQGHARVRAVQDWVRSQVRYVSNSSVGTTTACDTLASGQGVCRDFAHVMIALCRALNLPARFTTGLDYGADPILGPPDFHAYVEVYLSHRWFLFDPSGTAIPMGFVRIATGRDAADSAFATLFGPVQAEPMQVSIRALPPADGSGRLPIHCADALSTDTGPA
ncbi:MAG: hypothetical protein RL722_1460 [Pseudomonadota bacterium]|jgi:transglutaminase-like putative cysteine protease